MPEFVGLLITTRRILATAVMVFSGLALILIARQAADATPTSDTAVIESYTLLASGGQLLLGPYSRFQWHHPGPLYFFWMAPFYALAGFRTTGLNAAALALNLASIALIVWVVVRRAGSILAISTSAAIGVFVWRAAEVLTSPWNPHISLLPMMALIVVAADAVSGSRAMLPLVAVLASLAGQTHVGLLPSSLAIGGVALVWAAVAQPALEVVPGTDMRGGGVRRDRFGPTVLVTGLVLLVLWIPPLIDQFTGHPGNITRLWAFFVSESRRSQTISAAVSAWSDMLSALGRPDFYVAHGWVFRESRVKWSETLAVVQLVALGASAVWAFRAGRRFELAFASLLALVSLLALGSATRIEGAIFDHEVFWLAGVGVLNLAVLLALLARLFVDRIVPPVALVRAAAPLGWVLLAMAAIIGVRHLREAVVHSTTPGVESEAARAVADDLRAYLAAQDIVRPLVRIDQDAWGMAAGVILQLQKDGVPVAVEDDWLAMFTPRFAASGQESVVLTMAGKAQHVRMIGKPGDSVVVSHDPLFVHRDLSGG